MANTGSNCVRHTATCIAGIVAIGAGIAQAATPSTWQIGGDGAWSTPGNWTNGAPNGIDHVANLTADISETTAAVIDTPVVLGTLNIGDPAGSPRNAYNIAPNASGSLTFKTSSGNAFLKQLGGPGSPGNNTLGAFSLESDLDITAATNVQFTLNGGITGTGNITITSDNIGRIYLVTGASSFVGNFTLNGGTLLTGSSGNNIFGNTDSATGNRVITINNNATMQLNGNLPLSANRRLVIGTGGATIHVNSRVLTFGTTNQLSGSTPLALVNSGTVTFNSANSSFTGALNVGTTSGGTFTVNLNAADAVGGDIAIGATSSVVVGATGSVAANKTVTIAGGTFDTAAKASYTVAAGQTIAGTGTWAGATSSNTILGTLSVGPMHGSAGEASTLSVSNGTLVLAGVTEFDLFTESTADALLTAGVEYGGTLRVAKADDLTLAEGQQWDLFDGDRSGLTTFANTFAYDDPNLPSLPSHLQWSFDYDAGVLSITAVPEPATAGALTLLGTAMLVRRRRRIG